MAPKTIPDPTNTSPIIFTYTRNAAGAAVMSASYVTAGAQNDSGTLASTPAVSTIIDNLINSTIGWAMSPGDRAEVILDTVNVSMTINVQAPNATISGQFRVGSFTAAQRVMARNVLTQALADGLKTAMGF